MIIDDESQSGSQSCENFANLQADSAEVKIMYKLQRNALNNILKYFSVPGSFQLGNG